MTADREHLAAINRALESVLDLADLDLMPMVCVGCLRVYEVKDAEGEPGVGHGLCREDCISAA